MTPSPTLTGRRRRRTTSRSVFLADFVARAMITVGGIGTILAVMVVFAFLAAVVWPLLQPADFQERGGFQLAAGKSAPLHLAADEHGILGWTVLASGDLHTFGLDDGSEIERQHLFEDRAPSAAAFTVDGLHAVFGFEDGTFAYCRFEVRTDFLERDAIDDRVRALGEGEYVVSSWPAPAPDGEAAPRSVVHGCVQRVHGRYRAQSLHFEILATKRLGSAPIRLMDLTINSAGVPLVAALLTPNEGPPALRFVASRRKKDMLSGEEKLRFLRSRPLPIEALESTPPTFLKLSGDGRNIFLAWSSGAALRIANEPPRDVFIAQRLDLVPGAGVRLTHLEYLLGRQTLLVGSSDGALTGWFTVPCDGPRRGWIAIDDRLPGADGKPADVRWIFRAGSPELAEFRRRGTLDHRALSPKAIRGTMDLLAPNEDLLRRYRAATPADDRELVHAKTLVAAGPAVTAIASSSRSRLICAGFADGSIGIYQVTNEYELARAASSSRHAVSAALILPKEDGVLALSGASIKRWSLDAAHAEVTLRGLFGPVWYEGRPEPIYEWQSSASTDESEAKLSLAPMIYGTLKATFYSFLFGAPLALGAAIYTSEFLKPRWKSRIKPTIELMASLPSVVLGFLAGLIFAPVADHYLSGILATCISVPLAFLCGAYLWQLLPYRLSTRWQGWRFALMLAAALPLGTWAGLSLLGPLIERLFFLGDLKAWLHGADLVPLQGERFGGWFFMLLPLGALLVALVGGRASRSWMAGRAQSWSRARAATMDALRFLAAIAATVVLSAALAWIAGALDDPRGEGSFLHTFDRKNALVVGIIMGFAMIPIIYTIAEDALSTVPAHLRSASLGAGATPWQTAVRIVIPTAMSGLFSAAMIGLGRAVGETMIVLMATGGTPIMEPNIFNGFRTLSQNIATELPEAPPGSSHYRTLFLAGLLLFMMTLVLNTVAEVVRLRFRKRAFEL